MRKSRSLYYKILFAKKDSRVVGESRFLAIHPSQKYHSSNLVLGTVEVDQRKANDPHRCALTGFSRHKTLQLKTAVTGRHTFGAIDCRRIKFHWRPPGRSLEKAHFLHWFMQIHSELHLFCTMLAGSKPAKYSVPQSCTRFSLSPVHSDFPVSELICKVSKSCNRNIDTGIGYMQLIDNISPLNSLD